MAIAAFVEPEIEYEPHAERLFADRILRVWQITEHLAACPGRTRKELAFKFGVSERQLQADLNLIKREFGLPLVRRGGYRFAADEDERALTLADVELLLLLVRRALADPFVGVPQARIRSLMEALSSIAPVTLRPLVQAGLSDDGRQALLFAQLAHAVVARSWVRLEYRDGAVPIREPIVRPEVILPYAGDWYVLGQCRQRGRLMVFPLQPVIAVSAA